MDNRSFPEPDDIPEDLIHLVKPELQPGERLLWASRSGPGSYSTSSGFSTAAWIWFFVVATISVGSIAARPWAVRIGGDIPNGFLVLGVIFGIITFLIGLGFLSNFSSKRTERQKLEGQVHALTDRTAVIWLPAEKSAISVHTFQRGTIKGEALHRVQYPDGSGNVLFEGHDYGGASGLGFLGIAEVRRVMELVRRFLVVQGQGLDRVDELLLD